MLQSIYDNSLSGFNASESVEFNQAIAAAEGQSSATSAILKELTSTMKAIRKALDQTPADVSPLELKFAAIHTEISAITQELSGLKSREQMGVKPANILSRLSYAMSAVGSSYGPMKQHHEQLSYAENGLKDVSQRIKLLQEVTIPALQNSIITASRPWTRGATISAN